VPSLGIDLANTVYALDSTTIDLCMTLFPWAHYKRTQHAGLASGRQNYRGAVRRSQTSCPLGLI